MSTKEQSGMPKRVVIKNQVYSEYIDYSHLCIGKKQVKRALLIRLSIKSN